SGTRKRGSLATSSMRSPSQYRTRPSRKLSTYSAGVFSAMETSRARFYSSELRRVAHAAAHARKRARHELERHEGIARRGVGESESEAHGRHEAEARVVGRVTQHHEEGCAELAAGLDARAGEHGAGAVALVLGQHGERGQAVGRRRERVALH